LFGLSDFLRRSGFFLLGGGWCYSHFSHPLRCIRGPLVFPFPFPCSESNLFFLSPKPPPPPHQQKTPPPPPPIQKTKTPQNPPPQKLHRLFSLPHLFPPLTDVAGNYCRKDEVLLDRIIRAPSGILFSHCVEVLFYPLFLAIRTIPLQREVETDVPFLRNEV